MIDVEIARTVGTDPYCTKIEEEEEEKDPGSDEGGDGQTSSFAGSRGTYPGGPALLAGEWDCNLDKITDPIDQYCNGN